MDKKLIKFLSTTEGTVSVIKKAPPSEDKFKKLIKKVIIDESKLVENVLLGDDMINAMKVGYKNAILGFLHSAEENNRFLIERASLSTFITHTTTAYYEALKNMDWHKLVDDGFIIRSGGEALTKIRKYAGIREVNATTIYFTGVPVCEKHLKWEKYAMSLHEIFSELGMKKNKKEIKCKYCKNDAKYFILAMPKASALIALACETIGKNSNTLLKIYANLSRILHPYGFTNLNKNVVFTIWARDLLMILSEINELLFPCDFKERRGSSNNRKSALQFLKDWKSRKNGTSNVNSIS